VPEYAWRSIAGYETCLQVGNLSAVGQAFDGDHLAAIGLHRKHQAAAHHDTIDAHRTGTTNTVLAAEMRTRESQLCAQEVHEMLTYRHHADNRFAVDGQRNGNCFLSAHGAARIR